MIGETTNINVGSKLKIELEKLEELIRKEDFTPPEFLLNVDDLYGWGDDEHKCWIKTE
jgi:hypothetical protein